MADPGITLNIYNKPPQIDPNQNDNNDNNDNINQNETRENLNEELPVNTIRIDSTSAPRANDLQTMDNTRNEMVDTIENNQSSIPPNQQQQYQGRPMPIYAYQTPPIRPVQPMMVIPAQQQVYPQYNVPYNQYTPNSPYTPYPQQVYIPQQVPRQQINNTKPQTVVIKERKEKDDTAKDCCGGFLAGCCAVLAACCLLSLCAGGGGRRRGR